MAKARPNTVWSASPEKYPSRKIWPQAVQRFQTTFLGIPSR
jgi:hypothetical protein